MIDQTNQQNIPPLRVQLALQGGGAKLIFLLAAMEAVQELHRKKVIEVTRVAGTSAGSIAACLFAADVDIIRVKDKLQNISAKQLARNFPKTFFNAAKKIPFGNPLWSSDFFRDQLYPFFEEKKVSTLEQIKNKFHIEPFVMATNLNELRAVVYSAKDKDKNIVEAIIDSCALPFCFRGWKQAGSQIIVDGGICENLPSEVLEEENKDLYGPVIGISFDDRLPNPPNTLVGFTTALLNTAINHSVNRAKRRLGSHIFSIDTSISTFDFKKAFSSESDTEYKYVKKETLQFFSNYISTKDEKKVEIITPIVWEQESKNLMENLWKVYENQHRRNNLRYLKSSLEVYAASLRNNTEPDYVWYELTFKTLDEPIYCFEFTMSVTDIVSPSNNFEIKQTEFSIYQEDPENQIEVIYFATLKPSNDSITEKQSKVILINFVSPLPANSGPYTLTCKDTVQNFVGGIKNNKSDYLQITSSRAQGNIDKLDMVLHIPDSFKDIKMHQPNNWGQKMNLLELRAYNEHPKFKRFGWTADNVNSTQPFRIDLFL
jgi:predicted acylesterase/phospholipase RssA